jgi:hypothetical protein
MEQSTKKNTKDISKDSPLGSIVKKKPLVEYTPESMKKMDKMANEFVEALNSQEEKGAN